MLCNFLCVLRRKILAPDNCRRCDRIFDLIFHDEKLTNAVLVNRYYGKIDIMNDKRFHWWTEKEVNRAIDRIINYYDPDKRRV